MDQITYQLNTYSLNVNLEGVEGVLSSRLKAFLEELDSFFFKEVLDSWLSNSAVVCCAVSLDSPFHILQIVVSSEDSGFREFSHSLDEVLIAAIQYNDAAWEDTLVFFVLVKSWKFSFWELLFFFLNHLAVFIVLNDFLEEGVLSSSVDTRIAIKDVASVSAVVLAKLELQALLQQVIRHTDLTVFDNDFRPAVLRLFPVFAFCSSLVDFFFHGCFDFFKFGAAVISKFVFARCLLINGGSTEHFVH